MRKIKKEAWKMVDGNARASIYPTGPNNEPWSPKTNMFDNSSPGVIGPTEEQVMRIRGVEEVGSCGDQGYHVIVTADDYRKLQQAIGRVKKILAGYFARSIKQHKGASHGRR